MKIVRLTVIFIFGFSLCANGFVRESEKSMIKSDILNKKKSYEANSYTADGVRQFVKEKRKERNSKVHEIMKYAKESNAPASLFMKSVCGGVVDPELWSSNEQEAIKWKKKRTQPKELNIPWGKLFMIGFLLIIGTVAVIIRNGKVKESKRLKNHRI